MYKIEKADFGFKLAFSGFIGVEEMLSWLRESEELLSAQKDAFSVFVDMRMLRPLSEEAMIHVKAGQKLYKQMGMERSVVILNSPATTEQFKKIARETGIDKWERYIDATVETDWHKTGMDWIIKGLDPDKKKEFEKKNK
jgi:hypothetical protein